MFELRHLRTLQALRNYGSLARAADSLFVTQSALSHQIKELEGRLMLTLYHRKGRPLRFTAAGERLLLLADQILPQVVETQADLKRLACGEGGRLHLAVECHSCFDWILPTMEQYRPRWPLVELDITLAFNFDPFPALQRADVDLVISSDPCSLPGVRYLPLFQFQGVLVVSPEHPLAQRPYIAPADLAGETLITYPVDTQRLDIYRRFLEPAGVQPAARRTTELTPILLQLVASQRGVAALPAWAAQDAEAKGNVVTRPLGVEGLWRTLYAAVRTRSAVDTYIIDFVATARQTSLATLGGIRAELPGDAALVS